MSNTLGKAIRLTLIGESHGPAIGAVIDGLPPGLKVDTEYIAEEMDKRRPAGKISTARHEKDIPEFISGVKNGYTQGTPLTLLIRNENARSSDYDKTSSIPRPSHADFTAQAKYLGFQDAAGGGHFSGRLTAPIVAAGAILKQALEEKGIIIGTHISKLHGICDRAFAEDPAEDIKTLNKKLFAVLDEAAENKMITEIEAAAAAGDSVGGVLETAVCGLEAGLGEPWFGAIESELAAAIFAIPAVKGIEFGAGFAAADMKGSEANDPFAVKDSRIITLTNHSGGIQGGISNGMPIVFRTAIKPTPSISLPQKSTDLKTFENTELTISGRHDPAIVHRARAVVDSVTALVLADLIARRCGYMTLRGKQ